jgi:tetratricopeptide (TPR) repeat protein
MSTETYISEIIDEGFTESREELAKLCRAGDFFTARELVESLTTDDLERRVWAATNLAYIEWGQGHLSESLRMLLEIEPLTAQCSDEETLANFHLGLANTLEEIAEKEGQESYFDRALIEFEAARYHFYGAGQYAVAGAVENNIGNLKIKVGYASESHEHFRRARDIYSSLERPDRKYRLAEVDNTEAESFLAENNPQEAIHYSIRSVDALRYGDEPMTLERSLQTLKACLQALDDRNRTQLTATALQEAGSVAKAARRLGISRTAVEKRIKGHPELEVFAHRGKARGVNKRADY